MKSITRIKTEEARRWRSGIASLLCVFALAAVIAPFAASADDEILVLSSKHLGMTNEEIAESERAPAPEVAPENEWRSDHSEAAAPVCPPASVAVQSVVAGYEGCVEAAIRAGNGFGESSRVCRSLFPEQTAEAQKSEPEAAANVEAGSAIQ